MHNKRLRLSVRHQHSEKRDSLSSIQLAHYPLCMKINYSGMLSYSVSFFLKIKTILHCLLAFSSIKVLA